MRILNVLVFLIIFRLRLVRSGISLQSRLNISEAEQTWILANPPYGNRLGRDDDLIALYRLLGDRCKVFANAILGLITSERELVQALGLRSNKKWEMQAGGLKLNIARFELGLSV